MLVAEFEFLECLGEFLRLFFELLVLFGQNLVLLLDASLLHLHLSGDKREHFGLHA